MNQSLSGFVTVGCFLDVLPSSGFPHTVESVKKGGGGWSAPRCAGPAECGSLQAVLREPWEQSLKGPLSNLIEDFGGSFLLENGVAVHPEDVVDSTDVKTREEGQNLSAGPGTAGHVRA